MNRFLVIGFDFQGLFYYSLIRCKAKSDYTEYRITVMDGDIEKLLCNNNIIKEIDGCLQFELSGNKLQNHIKTEVATALGKVIGMTVQKVEVPQKEAGEKLQAKDQPPDQKDNILNKDKDPD